MKKEIHITLAEPRGFCAGVDRLNNEIKHLEVLYAAKQHSEHQERQHHRNGDGPELTPLARAVAFGSFVNAVRY